MKALFFPWPAGPGIVREDKLNLASIQQWVGGDFEAHTLSNGCVVLCHEYGRAVYRNPTVSPYLFPYIGFDLPPPDDGDEDGFRMVIFGSFEEMMAVPRKECHIDVYGPCIVLGPADEDGEHTDVTEEQIASLNKVGVR